MLFSLVQNSWTALLAATSGGYADVVGEILEKNANANALDKVSSVESSCLVLTRSVVLIRYT